MALAMASNTSSGPQDKNMDCEFLPASFVVADSEFHMVLAHLLTFCAVGAHIGFGYTTDQHEHDHDQQQVLLNQQQQGLMADFWDNPDGAQATTGVDDQGSFSFTGYAVEGFGQAHNQLYHDAENAVNFAHNNQNIGNAGSQGELQPAAGSANLSQFDGMHGLQNWYDSTAGASGPASQQQSIDHMSGDGEAASALMNLSTSHGHNHEHQQPTSAGAWGALSLMHGGEFAQGNKIQSPVASEVPSATSSASQVQHGPYYSQLYQQASERARAAHSHSRHQSLQLPNDDQAAFASQWQMQPTEQRQTRPVPITYGSDDNFGQNGYHGGYSRTDGKEGNLLGVPLAGQAAVSADMQHVQARQTAGASAGGHQQAQQRHSVPNIGHAMRGQPASPNKFNASSLPQQFARPNLPYSALNTMSSNGSAQASRKRKKSQAGDNDDDDEYVPSGTPRRARRGSKTTGLQDALHDTFATPESIRRRRSIALPESGSDASSPPTPADNANIPVAATRRRRVTTEPKQGRTNLTEHQKRANHIKSEQNRRDGMKENYAKINNLVPALRGGTHGGSRADALQHAGDYLSLLQNINVSVFNSFGFTIDMFRDMRAPIKYEESDDEEKYDIGPKAGGDGNADDGDDFQNEGATAPFG